MGEPAISAPRDDGVSLARTEQLIRLLRSVIANHVEVHADGRAEDEVEMAWDHAGRATVWMIGTDAGLSDFVRETDDDLAAQYGSAVISPQLAAIEAVALVRGTREWHDWGYRWMGIFLYKSFHVLNRIQETWLVKFTVDVSGTDTWGRVFLGKLREFGDALHGLTACLLARVTAAEWTQRSGFFDEPLNAAIYTQWEDVAVKFVSLLLFVFDVGLALRAGADEGRLGGREDALFEPARAFSSRSVVRSRVLENRTFMIYLEVCAWKVLTVSSLDSPYYDFRLAIPEVCRALCTRLSAVKDACLEAEGRDGFLDNWDGTRSTDRRHVVRAITRVLQWRNQWEAPDAVRLLQQYQAALAPLQLEFAVNLAGTVLAQDTAHAHAVDDSTVGRDVRGLLDEMRGMVAVNDHLHRAVEKLCSGVTRCIQ